MGRKIYSIFTEFMKKGNVIQFYLSKNSKITNKSENPDTQNLANREKKITKRYNSRMKP